MNRVLTIDISAAVALRELGVAEELTVVFDHGGPDGLPHAYRWRAPQRECWARVRCARFGLCHEGSMDVETPKRPYGRLGRGFQMYAATIPGGGDLVRAYCRCGRNDPRTQEAAAAVLRYALTRQFGETALGRLAWGAPEERKVA